MHEGLEGADREGVPIWLETSKATNAAYYEGFGFRTVVAEDAPAAARTSGSCAAIRSEPHRTATGVTTPMHLTRDWHLSVPARQDD